MSYIHFDKTQLINLQYSLSKELLRTNRAGSYASSTIINTNTRKYHGLLIVPQPLIDDKNHVLLSTLDETITTNGFDFHLSARMFEGGTVYPKGHKYIRDFESEPNPRLVYRMGQVVFVRENIFLKNEDRILVRYTLQDSQSKVTFKINPFLAYRNTDSLSVANTWVDTRYKEVKNGISWQMYQGYSRIFMQFSSKVRYTHVPDWHHKIEYIREMERGYPHTEDLYVPGYFEIDMKKGDSIVISIGLKEATPSHFKRQFNSEINKRTQRDSFEHCLINAAEEFIVKQDKKTMVIAGYPWFGRWGRDTFISLPGLTLAHKKDEKSFKEVMKTILSELKNGLFPNVGHGKDASYNSVDSSMWFFWALHQFSLMTGKKKEVWKEYGIFMKRILNAFEKGTLHNIKMHNNGLIWAGEKGKALTWMDTIIHGKPTTPRIGYTVEVNALWYDAVVFSLELAELANDTAFIKKWSKWPDIIKNSFNEIFWNKETGYLADYVEGDYKDMAVRPNQIFAVSVPNSPLDRGRQSMVVEIVKNELLTDRGIRSLSPKNPLYKGKYKGDQATRDAAYHQGVAWPWLLGSFAEAYLKLYGKEGKEFVESLYDNFENEMINDGIGTISEVYDGDPPHTAGGAISQAWSISELLRIKWLLNNKID